MFPREPLPPRTTPYLEPSDPLATARGIIIGAAIGAAMWLLIIAPFCF